MSDWAILMTHSMRTSKTGLDLIKGFEGFRARATQLPDGRWTIGHGHTKTARENLRITPADAEAVLREYDLPPIEAILSSSVLAPLNQNEFDALVSFVFNIGGHDFLRSNTLGHLNSGQPLAAAHAMANWRKASVNGRLIVVDALVRRRTMEQALFLKPPSGTIAAPSGFIRPVSEAAGDAQALSRPVETHTKHTQKPATTEAHGLADAKRLTRELGRVAAQTVKAVVKPEPLPEASKLTQGPTPDEITRAISALVGPDGNASETSGEDQAWHSREKLEKPKIEPSRPPLFGDDGSADLPPLPGMDYGDDIAGGVEKSTLGSRLIDDLEPVEVDLALLEKAEAEAEADENASLVGDLILQHPRRIMHGVMGSAGLLVGAWGLYRILQPSTGAAVPDDGLYTYLSMGGAVVGMFLILLAVYLAFRSGASEI